MSKLELMEKFMNTFVGSGFLVHTIEIMQKVDETCPVKNIPVGDYFLHLLATDQHGEEESMVCNWSQELLRNLLENHKLAKEARKKQIVMFRNSVANDPNSWMLAWGNREQPKTMQPAQIAYVS